MNKIQLALYTKALIRLNEPTEVGKLANNLWQLAWNIIKEVGQPLAFVTLVSSAFYYFTPWGSKNNLDMARKLMIGSIAGLVIIYLGPTVVNYVISVLEQLGQ